MDRQVSHAVCCIGYTWNNTHTHTCCGGFPGGERHHQRATIGQQAYGYTHMKTSSNYRHHLGQNLVAHNSAASQLARNCAALRTHTTIHSYTHKRPTGVSVLAVLVFVAVVEAAVEGLVPVRGRLFPPGLRGGLVPAGHLGNRGGLVPARHVTPLNADDTPLVVGKLQAGRAVHAEKVCARIMILSKQWGCQRESHTQTCVCAQRRRCNCTVRMGSSTTTIAVFGSAAGAAAAAGCDVMVLLPATLLFSLTFSYAHTERSAGG